MQPPEQLEKFLKSGNQLSYDYKQVEAGRIVLKKWQDLQTGVVWIDSFREGDEGYYEIPAVNLVESCDGYDPEFILLWLPNEKVFGTWDCDHWGLIVFPETTWSEIVKSPVPFLNAQWSPDSKVGKQFQVSSDYQRKSGRPF
ncbi:MAG: hypothetical protein AAFP70_11310 [Calditrichota bacterium]